MCEHYLTKLAVLREKLENKHNDLLQNKKYRKEAWNQERRRIATKTKIFKSDLKRHPNQKWLEEQYLDDTDDFSHEIDEIDQDENDLLYDIQKLEHKIKDCESQSISNYEHYIDIAKLFYINERVFTSEDTE